MFCLQSKREEIKKTAGLSLSIGSQATARDSYEEAKTRTLVFENRPCKITSISLKGDIFGIPIESDLYEGDVPIEDFLQNRKKMCPNLNLVVSVDFLDEDEFEDETKEKHYRDSFKDYKNDEIFDISL
jgi:hypothetical protein